MPLEDIILTGTKTAAQNINGAEGTEANLTWDVVAQDATEITSFSNGDSVIQITKACWINLHASCVITNGAANNRTMIMLSLVHTDSADTEKYTYRGDVQYNRDDADAYDASGGCIDKSMICCDAGDKLYLQTRILDDGTAIGTMAPDTTYSKIRIARITF